MSRKNYQRSLIYKNKVENHKINEFVNTIRSDKNFLVTFRMYQLNFTKEQDWIYKKYLDKYPVHFIEEF